MPQIRHPQWREEHVGNRYPFEDGASLTNADGEQISQDAVIDASLYPLGASGQLYLSRIVVQPDVVRISVGDAVLQEFCYGELTSVTDTQVTLQDAEGRPAGILLLDNLQAAKWFEWAPGEHAFEPSQTPFVAAVCMPLPETRGLTQIVLDDGNVVTGPALLVGKDGVVLACEQAGGRTVVRINVVGDPLFLRKACSPGLFETPRFIRRIVFQKGGVTIPVGPGSVGDVTMLATSVITPDTILRIHPTNEGAQVELVGERLDGSN